MKPQIYFVSAGPGNVELLTVKAYRVLAGSDVVFYAGSLVNPSMLSIIKENALLIDMKSLSYEEIRGKLLAVSGSSNIISILHAGDSSIYSAINEQMAYLEEMGFQYEIIPGVTAAFAASASNKTTLTLPDVSQAVIICRAEGRTGKLPLGQDLSSLASHGATMAIYLSFSIIHKVVSDLLEHYSPDTPCLIAQNVSTENERLINCTLKEVIGKSTENSITNMTVLIIGNALTGKSYKNIRSKLYDKNFSHSFRSGKSG